MRKAPGAIYSKVINSPIADGTALYIDYTANGWGYTTYNGYEGWVALNQTTTTPPAAPPAQNPSVTQPADNSSVGEGIKTQDAPSAKTSEDEQERAEEKKASIRQDY